MLLHWLMAFRRKAAEFHEGPEAARQADNAMARILSVSKDELARREAEYQESRQDKDRPGPKPSKRPA